MKPEQDSHIFYQNDTIEAELHRRNHELSLLNRIIAASVNLNHVEPTQLLETACYELSQFFEAHRVWATQITHHKTTVSVIAIYHSDDAHTMPMHTVPLTESPIHQHLLRHKTPLVLGKHGKATPQLSSQDTLFYTPDTALLILPLTNNNEIIGCLGVEVDGNYQFTASDLSLGWNVVDQVSSAISHIDLTKQQQLLIKAVEQAAESVVITDTAGTIVYVNPAFEDITGYSREEAIGQNPRLLKSGKHPRTFYVDMWDALKAGRVWHGRMTNKTKDGHLFTEDATISPVRNANGDITNYVAVKHNITYELELEAQYHQVQKMEAIGRLAGGVAHDFNNILTVLMGHSDVLAAQLSPTHPAMSDVQEIKKNLRRAASLTRQLLLMTRKKVVKPVTLNLNEVIAAMERMLRRFIGEDIQLITHTDPKLGLVNADAGQLEQVLLNLAVNAREAMPQGGRLSIETSNVTLDESYQLQTINVPPGEYALITVSDNGPGMSAEVREHIFEPFYTTKKNGTGLGLSICFGIVRQNQGHIWVYSEEGQGTTFKIYLPRLKAASPTAILPPAPQNISQGTETILLVEDELAVRLFITRALKRLGYVVLEATHGHEALDIVRAPGTPHIDLLLTDVVTPEMSGPQLAERLLGMYPNLKIVFMSGYPDASIINHPLVDPNANFLQKPFSPTDLTQVIRTMLDANPGPSLLA